MLEISEIIFSVASKGWCCSVDTSAALCDQSWQQGLSPVLWLWPCGLGSVLKGLTLLSLPSPHFWAFRSLWKSWRNIPVYEPTLYFCDKAERIKSPRCIFFPRFGTTFTAEVGFVFPTRGPVPSLCTLLFIRVLRGYLASCPPFPQTSGKPGEMLGYKQKC